VLWEDQVVPQSWFLPLQSECFHVYFFFFRLFFVAPPPSTSFFFYPRELSRRCIRSSFTAGSELGPFLVSFFFGSSLSPAQPRPAPLTVPITSLTAKPLSHLVWVSCSIMWFVPTCFLFFLFDTVIFFVSLFPSLPRSSSAYAFQPDPSFQLCLPCRLVFGPGEATFFFHPEQFPLRPTESALVTFFGVVGSIPPQCLRLHVHLIRDSFHSSGCLLWVAGWHSSARFVRSQRSPSPFPFSFILLSLLGIFPLCHVRSAFPYAIYRFSRRGSCVPFPPPLL